MGIGQIQIIDYRLKLVDYLPHMYLYEFIWMHKRPESITSYETILLPFDRKIWAFTIVSTIFAFITLLMMQKIYSYASGQDNPHDYINQGIMFNTISVFYFSKKLIISDFCCLVTGLIGQGASESWLNRVGFNNSRKLLLIQWLICANFLLMGYKSVLLSSLVSIRYEDTIDTLYELERSNLPLLIPKGAGLVEPLEKDPRPIVKKIFNQSKLYPYAGDTPDWVYDRYLIFSYLSQ